MSEGGRVLVCDDEVQILRALRVILRDAGFEVVTPATAEEALDRVAARPADAAIVDLVPDGDGIEALWLEGARGTAAGGPPEGKRRPVR